MRREEGWDGAQCSLTIFTTHGIPVQTQAGSMPPSNGMEWDWALPDNVLEYRNLR